MNPVEIGKHLASTFTGPRYTDTARALLYARGKREDLIRAALREYTSQVHLLPLHRQVIPWAARANVDVVHRADNWLEVRWVSVK